MENSRFDGLTRGLMHARTRRGLARLLVGLARGGSLAVLGAHGAEAKRKKGKNRKKKKRKQPVATVPSAPPAACVPEAQSVTCGGAPCGSVRANNCGQAVNCGCPPGSKCLLNGTCARMCVGHSGDCDGCAGNAFCTNENTEGQQHCVLESACADHQECFTSTSECPRGTQCQDCGIGQGRRCIPVAFCPGA
jgi:hypothetical protein